MIKLPARAIVNIDETNVDFDQAPKTTLAPIGHRTIRVASSGPSSRCTALLGVALDGTKLPPFIVFKASRTGRIIREVTTRAEEFGYPEHCVYSVQAKGWMCEELMLEWIERVWKPWIEAQQLESSLLIVDSFKGHTTSSVFNALNDCGTGVDIIPGGYTGDVQVLDVGINKPFKNGLQPGFEMFLRNRTSSKQKPSRVEVSKWISAAWCDITPEMIINTWRHIGIKSRE
jgi:hypothetical protein